MYNEGSLDSKICLIGEAPGEQEARTGRPFVGPAGELLNELLLAAGLLRSQCYLTNVVKERPPHNDISKYIVFRGDDARLTEEYMQYEKQLYSELSTCKANVFVPLGNVSMFALTRLTKITKRRGSILTVWDGAGSGVAGRKVIPTIHPAACLHSTAGGGMYLYRYYIIHDLVKAKEQAEFPELRTISREIKVFPSFADVIGFLKNVKEYFDRCAVDIETFNNQVSCISFATSPLYAISIPFIEDKKEDYFTLDQELEIWKLIKLILEDSRIVKLGQNLAFDTSFLFHRYGIETVNIEDTMVAQSIISPGFPKGLDFITSIYTDIPYYKDEGKKWREGGSEAFWIYNAKDSLAVMDAFPKMLDDLRQLGNIDTYNRQKGIIPCLVYMQERGIRMDVEGMKTAKVEAEKRFDRLQEELNRMCGKSVNHQSYKQMQELFYVTLGYPPYMKDGKMTVDDTALKRLKRKGCIHAGIVEEMRHLSKMTQNYLDLSKIDDDGRYRSSYNPVGTVNGRLSSSETIFGTGGNLQNWSPELKQYMIADEGFVLYEVDLNQAENRIVAYTSPEPLMISAFEHGIDVHAQTASMISRLPIEEVIRQHKEKIPCELGDGTKTWRFWGKKADHGLNYGEGYKKFALVNELQEKESRVIVEAYHMLYPGIRHGQEWTVGQLRKNRILENCYGRRRLFLDRWGPELFNQAYNFNPQSTVADKINEDGLLFIWSNPQFDIDLLNQVHDSIVFQLPLSTSIEQHLSVLKEIKQSLEKPITWKGTSFVIPVTVKVGYNLRDMKEVSLSVESLSQAL